MSLKVEDENIHGEIAISYDHDALIAFQLRARLDDFKFGITYQCMQELKWTYKNGSYRSPCGSRLFESSKQVEDALDRFAVPDIESALGRWKANIATTSSNQQLPLHRRIDNSGKKEEIDRKLREDLLTCLFKKVFKKPAGKTSKSDSRNKRTSKGRTAEPQPKRGRRSASTAIQAIPDRTTTSAGQTHLKHATTLTEQDRYLLSTNHCLILYGYGSKRATLDDFASNILSQDGDVIEISGYDQNVRMDEFLDVFVTQFLDGNDPEENRENKLRKTSPSSKADIGMNRKHILIKRAKSIAETLARTRDYPLYLVLHSIDGVAFRSQTVQEALAALVLHSGIETTGSPTKSPAIRLVASVDHVNAISLLQEVDSWMSLNWIWKEVHTYQPYDEEVKASGIESLHKTAKGSSRGSLAKLGRGDGSHEGSLQTILTSLAKRHAETLQALAGLQLKTKEEKQPVNYRALRQECLHKMIAGQDSVLRDYLTELVDHEIVERFVDEDTATEKLLIPYPGAILQEILTFQL